MQGAAAHDAAAAGNPLLVGAEFDDTTPDAVDEGDVGRMRISSRRELYVQLRDAAGNERGLNVDASGNIGVTDAGSSLTIDGTVTANLGATDNAVLDSIDAAVNGTLAVSGTVTANLGATDNAVLDSIDAAVNGTLTADVSSVIPGNGATNLGKAVDAAAGGTDTGIATLAVRDDALSSLTPAEGDYAPLRVDSEGALHVRNANKISTANSTSTPLAGDATFTGTFEDVSNFATISVIVFADQASAADGLVFELSSDGTNVDSDDTYTISAGVGKVYSLGVNAQYLRVKYINGATIQGAFRLQTILHKESPKPSSHRIEDSPVSQDDAELVKAVIMAENPGGTFVNIGATTGGNFKVSVEEFDTALPAGTNSIGQVTANAGTNLNTSALALESGGNLATLAGAVAGTEVQVDVVAALPAGANAIGKLAANDGVDIGDVTLNNGFASVTGGGVESGALRVTLASDSTGVLSVDDNGGSLTIDNATLANAHSADFDTGAGTDTTPAFGIAVPASGGAAVIPGDATAGLKVDLGADNDVVVSGTVTANLSATDNAVLDAIQVAVETIDNAISGTEMQVDVVAALPAGDNNIGNVDIASALPAGTNAIGKLAANSGVDIGDVDVTSISAGSNLIGDVGISGARTSGGTTLYKNIDVDESEDEVKGTAGQVYWIHAINLGSAVRYLKFYNATAANVTVGTTVPDLTFPVPAQSDSNGAGFTLAIPNGIAFGTAITIAATTGVADNDSGAPGANEVVVNLGYA